MAESLGEKLRLAREGRGITISEVSAQTRIAARYLEAIEADNYKPLPGGVFNKGFIKAYAKYVGVDENEALSDYARIMSTQTADEDDDNRYRRSSVMIDDNRRSSWTSLIFAVIILALMSGGIYALMQWYRSTPAEEVKNPAANTANSNSAVNSNANAASAPAPVTALKIEFKSVSPTGTAITTWVDETKESATVMPAAPKTYEPKTSFRVAYSKYHAENVQLTLNGKTIQLPMKPFPLNDSNIRFEITKDNAAQIMQAGQITLGEPTPTPTPATTAATVDANVAPVAGQPAVTPGSPVATTPKPATPRPTVSPAKTPLVVGNAAATPAPRTTPGRPTPAPTIIITGTPKKNN